MIVEKMIKKYAKLLLEALRVRDKKYLFIQLPSFLESFKTILLDEAKSYDLDDVYVYEVDVFKKHELLSYLDQENINKHPMFDGSIFNKYAKLDAAFLFIQSMVPNLMDDIEPAKIQATTKHFRSTQKYFRDLYEAGKLNWCIAGVPNEYWASKGLNISLEELWNIMFKVCLVDDDNDPYACWNKKLEQMEKRCQVLNDYHFKYLNYTNDLGTDLTIYLPDKHVWCSGYGLNGEICNLPTEEIFTSPDYAKTKGIVYSTKPLFYNNILIENFYLKFVDGKVVDYKAESGEDVLKTIIESDDNSAFLGECALVSYDSPINETGVIFKETLYDENASCHLALGRGFCECLSDVDDDDIMKFGVDVSDVHVDFMIGDASLKITGVTDKDEEVIIMENGNLVI